MEAPAEANTGLSAAPHVVLTREAGKNGKLLAMLAARGVPALELPLVETAPGPDRDRLPAVLGTGRFDWAVITSPESAAVFLEGWRSAGCPQVRIAVVGVGTGGVLRAAPEAARLDIAFTPSKADAVHLAAELPLGEGQPSARVLYSASSKAGSDLQAGLAERGADVVRLNTYSTLPVSSLAPAALEQARHARVVAFASPSAVKAWLKLAGDGARHCSAACIGSTSARAAERLGFERVYFPDAPGLEGFVASIMDALDSKPLAAP
ncbi:hypothetical protein WJX81_003555 [Elliptochloris bilobata]|uniref:Uroporphyrinogen-III synthase n=1 Tax=Elliptochloris bilobata TaxID=381761 RepID=A0AAW1S3V5_9CHLO